MGDEIEEQRDIEENRAKAVILAGNPNLYMKLWPDKEEETEEWIVPETEEELRDIVRMFETGTVYDR